MSMTLKLQQHAKWILAYSNRARYFCSNTNGTLSSPAKNQTLLSRIESALERKAEITTVLEQWRRQQQYGNHQLNPSLVRSIVEKLHDSKRFHEALEISNWMIVHNICNLNSEDFKTRFHLIENVSGLEAAEKFFENISENQRNEAIYNSLLSSYAKRNEIDKAESTFKKMRELGLLLRASPYNSMTSLYSRSPGNRDKVDEILREMKESNIQLDSLTVNNVLRVYANASDIARMEKFLADWIETLTVKIEWLTRLDMAKAYLRDGSKEKARLMLHRAEASNDPKSYEGLMRLYGEAGLKDDIYRIWDLYKNTRGKDNEGVLAMIGILLKLDDINGAEEIYYREWEGSGLEFDVRIPNMLLSAYREKGMVEKAYKLMNKTMKNERYLTPITPVLEVLGEKGKEVKPSDLRDLIKTLCDSNQYSKALEASTWMNEKRLFNFFPEDYATRLHVIENVLGLEEAEKFFETSIPENMKDYSVYSTLLSYYARSNKTLSKAEAIFKKMRELGFLSKPFPYNSMISLYSQLGKRNMVDNLLLKMTEMNIEPDSLTINNVLTLYADETNIETMEKYKKKWVSAEKNTKLETRTMATMANAYKRAGQLLKAIEVTKSKEDVHRLWNKYKEEAKKEFKRDEEYRRVISSLLKLNDVKGAEEIYGEWDPRGPEYDSRIPCLLISYYSEEGNEVEVKEVVNSSLKKQKQLKFNKLFSSSAFKVSEVMLIPFSVIVLAYIFK